MRLVGPEIGRAPHLVCVVFFFCLFVSQEANKSLVREQYGGSVAWERVTENRSRAAGSVVIVVVFGVQAVQDGSSEREDGGAPSQAITPVELVVYSQADRLDELDGEQDQATGLQDNCGVKNNTKR